ncbi:MAG TPA: sulfur carrier protein ThiS [Verrucomicrobiae bacterium]|nr:sulfur carrier protein ThiS [Verrucomicrobiae bacterium]
MGVILNGKAFDLDDGATVEALIARLQLAGRRVAVELNGKILPRSQAGATRLKPGDAIEIVHAIGGG